MTGKGGPGSIAPPLVCCPRSTALCVVQSTEFRMREDLIFWKLSFWFFQEVRGGVLDTTEAASVVCRVANVLISLDPTMIAREFLRLSRYTRARSLYMV